MTRYQYLFSRFYHPFACDFLGVLNRDGLDGLLRWKPTGTPPQATVQGLHADFFAQAEYTPAAGAVALPYPTDDVSFENGRDPYAQYNWEVFFHAPLLIADRLRQNQQFEGARRWYQFIFDPTDGSAASAPQRFWRFLPFWTAATTPPTDELAKLLSDTDPTTRDELARQVEAWRDDPFNPHLIARLRTWAYPKAVVMKYLDNLIAWGDQLFRQDTIESITEATLLYILCGEILGARPEDVPPRLQPATTTYGQLAAGGQLDAFSNELVAAENVAAALGGPPPSPVNGPAPPPIFTLQFCVPPNDDLLRYWDTIADRLFKIRNCMNISGVVRELPLFEPPIDPRLLVAAAAAGVDLSSVLSDLYAPLPRYRFATALGRAFDLCADLRNLGAALLAAIDRRDAEALAQLRSGQEVDLLRAVRDVKTRQVDETAQSIEALNRQREMVARRLEYYTNISFLTDWEIASLSLLGTSAGLQVLSASLEQGAATAHAIPGVIAGAAGIGATPVSLLQTGGGSAGAAASAAGRAIGTLASLASTASTLSSIYGGFKRRQDDWVLQKELAAKELEQLDKHLLVANIRQQIAQQELDNHDRQIEAAENVDDFLRNRRFASRELFDWMVGQLSTVYFQTYQLAYDLAKRAERAFQFERAAWDTTFIRFGYWDSLKKGLLAGEQLQFDLRRMETQYLEDNKRDYELTKHVSLALLAPDALVMLRETGECHVELTEDLFDQDYPGHYLRRLKSVAVSIPCVVGPYGGVHCTLTLGQNSVRTSNNANSPYPRQDTGETRFRDQVGAIDSIATSTAQNDDGLFELSFRDDRYVPFEGAGLISRWRIALPKETNSFDFSTISDVIFHLRYTARDGGSLLRDRVITEVLAAEPREVSNELVRTRQGVRLFSARHELPDEWHQFLHPSSASPDQTFRFELKPERFPRPPGKAVQIDRFELFLNVKDLASYQAPLAATLGPEPLPAGSSPASLTFTAPSDPKKGTQIRGILPYAALPDNPNAPSLGASLGKWALVVPASGIPAGLQMLDANGIVRIDPARLQDLGVLCHYHWT
jgi:hypothetical protein